MTWQSLTTYGGSVLATGIVTQFMKDIPCCKRVPTRLFSYLVALTLLLLATAFTSGLTLADTAIVPINAMVVSLASNGAYDALNNAGRNRRC